MDVLRLGRRGMAPGALSGAVPNAQAIELKSCLEKMDVHLNCLVELFGLNLPTSKPLTFVPPKPPFLVRLPRALRAL